MTDDDTDDRDVLDVLTVYRPASPPRELRARVLATEKITTRPRPSLWPIAAGLALSALLQWAAARVDAGGTAARDTSAATQLQEALEGVPDIERLAASYRRSRFVPHREPLNTVGLDEVL
jgi:hypothetical protein